MDDARDAAVVPPVDEARDHVRGSSGRTLLVFGDYECPYTRRAYRSVEALEADGVPFRFAFRHFPLFEIHPHALAAAEASEAASAQGRFWPMHDLGMTAGCRHLDRSRFRSLAVALTVDLAEVAR
jgi:protein-disulfide isomerase